MIHLRSPTTRMSWSNGRIDRHGQRADEVVIWHPVDADGSHGQDILKALQKLDTMRADMGSVNPVIAPQLPDLLEGRRKTLDTTLADARIARSKQFVRAEKDLEERVKKLHDRLTETRDLQRFSPGNVERCVRTALRLADWPDLEPASVHGAPTAPRSKCPHYRDRGSAASSLSIRFRARSARYLRSRRQWERRRRVPHLNHQLVQMSLRLLRAQMGRVTTSRASSALPCALPDELLRTRRPRGPAAGRHRGQPHRLHEELTKQDTFAVRLPAKTGCQRQNYARAFDRLRSRGPCN